MKFFAFFILAAVAISAHALSDEAKLQLKEFVVECLTSTGVDKELIGKARTHDYNGRDPKLAAYYTCMLGKMRFQNDDGTFESDIMIKNLPANDNKEVASNAVKKCATYDAAISKDENSMNYVYCFYKTVGKDYKLF